MDITGTPGETGAHDAAERVLALDLGTGSVKAGVMGPDGRLGETAARDYPLLTPGEDRAEADPARWWAATREVVRELRALPSDPLDDLSGVAIAGQMHGVVLADGQGTPLRPAVLWPDRRAQQQLTRYREADDAALRRLGNPLVPGMMGPILSSLRADEPEVVARARWALSPKDWLRTRLTGPEGVDGPCAEPSDASATLLWDLEADDWHDEIVELLALPRGLLPPIVRSERIVGRLTTSAAAELQLIPDTPVIAGAADTAAALRGADTPPGALQLGIGTGAQWVRPLDGATVDTRTLEPEQGLHCYRAAGEGWYAMAAVQNAGLAFEWAWEVLDAGWDEAHRALEATEPGAQGVVFLPFLTGERTPHLDPGLRAAWLGAGRAHRRAHLLRAVFEGVAFAIRAARDALDGPARDAPVRLVGGGTTEPRWQALLADVLDTEVQVVDEPEATLRGAGLLALSALEGEAGPGPSPLRPRATQRPGPNAPAYQAAFTHYTERVHASRGAG
ncbi:xylulose kinase [Egibacter rhizosphaerae]|uniref:Xylulose kinase n=1 Tax=Egibacter rhizosphaerae TaxID=1670831 RepID=A0A411YED1_9ACTN|nr:FGGY family carbohydrate kinase [Egibacter rhizosphaerae]QBI19556.1 xylulose kinase [Egibacter rhizosphaerae]